MTLAVAEALTPNKPNQTNNLNTITSFRITNLDTKYAVLNRTE